MKAQNPYVAALKWIAILSSAIGVVFLLVGSTLAAQQPWNPFLGPSGFAGLAQLVWGVLLLSLGLLSTLLWLHAAAGSWKRDPEEHRAGMQPTQAGNG